MTIDETTRLWLRNESDEKAAFNGCRFDVLRGAWTIYWIERLCKLYEGEGYAGKPLILHGCRECDHSHLWSIPDFDEEAVTTRARLFSECVAAGHRIDWQYECLMRLFGWVRKSERWNREIRRFKQGSIWVPKKQKKSPTLAALGLYLTIGDGEPGNNVYLCAKDGAQAREIAAKHTVEMFRQSDELQSECTLNKSLMQITHEGSRSRLKPLSSANATTQESKEGLNGSILIDETHVVDRAFVDRISRAGISRSEPLMLEFSTAGNNPDGYGKERCDYSRDVAAGKREDEELFAAVYEAPQDVTDEQLEANLETYARMANPSIGHTIELHELKRDYERSKAKIENLANFKMYRMNIWQHSSNPWLRPSDWAACAAEYTEEDLLGKDCYVAYDMALKWDTACIVCVFPWGESGGKPRYRLWPYFFLPEVSARVTADKVSWRDWQASEFIRLTSGNTTDYPLIRSTIKEIVNKFNVCGPIAFDRKFGEYLSQDLQEEDGIEVLEFPQQPNHFLEPMEVFDAGVTDRRIEHPNNKVLNWQAGNATKDQKNGMLIKPRGEPVKKIDGIVAAVMAVGRATASERSNAWSAADGILL